MGVTSTLGVTAVLAALTGGSIAGGRALREGQKTKSEEKRAADIKQKQSALGPQKSASQLASEADEAARLATKKKRRGRLRTGGETILT